MRRYARKSQQFQRRRPDDSTQLSAVGYNHEEHPILQMQRTVGNQAVQHLLQLRRPSHQSEPVIHREPHGLVHPNMPVHTRTVTSPHIALKPAKEQGSVSSRGSMFVTMRLGWNQLGEDVVVKREVSAIQGYDDRLQAIAVARMSRAEPAAVAQDNDGKWHAFETTANFYGGKFRAADTPTRALYCLPPSTSIAFYRQEVSSLELKLRELSEMKNKRGNVKAIEEEETLVSQNLTNTRQFLASLIFGVPESEIQFNRSSFGRKSGKVNINAEFARTHGAPRGLHGPETKQGEDFDLGVNSAFEINGNELDNPAGAQSVMFHEVSHLKDYELAQQWVTKYVQETKRIFVSGPAGRTAFSNWMMAQAPRRLSKADAELIVDVAANDNTTTEARSYVHTFLAALQSGSLDEATSQLVTYAGHEANQLHPDKKGGSDVQTVLTKELQVAYRQMSKDMQRQFKAAVAAAKKKNPSSWVSKLDFSK